MTLSLFTTLLRLHVWNLKSYHKEHVETLLNLAIEGTPISKVDSNVSSLDVLIISLHDSQGWFASDPVFEFLDNCILRLIKRPVKYYDDLTSLASKVESDIIKIEDCEVNLLLLAVMEQWSFLVASASPSMIEDLVKWLVRYLDFSIQTGGHRILISHIRDNIKSLTIDGESCMKLSKALRQPAYYVTSHELQDLARSNRQISNDEVITHASSNTPALNEPWPMVGPSVEHEDHSALRSWIRKDIATAIRDGDIGQLILYLCSDQQDIRIQALVSLRKFMNGLEVACTPICYLK